MLGPGRSLLKGWIPSLSRITHTIPSLVRNCSSSNTSPTAGGSLSPFSLFSACHPSHDHCCISGTCTQDSRQYHVADHYTPCSSTTYKPLPRSLFTADSKHYKHFPTQNWFPSPPFVETRTNLYFQTFLALVSTSYKNHSLAWHSSFLTLWNLLSAMML